MAPSDELEALAKRHGATSYRNRADDTQHPAYGFTEDGLNGLIGEVLAKWGTPAGEGEVVACGNCGGTGWMVRDPDIGTDQECFVCDGSGRYSESATPQPTKAREIERLRQDAARYRWLRHGDNDEKVLKTYTSRPSEPGEPTMFLPRNDELDRLIDAARARLEGN